MALDTVTAVSTAQTALTSVIGTDPTTNVLVLLVGGGVAVFLAFLGRARLVALAMGLYIAVAVILLTDIMRWIGNLLPSGSALSIAVGTFLIALVVGYLLIQFSFGDLLEEDHGSMAATIIIAVTLVGLLLTLLFAIVPETLAVSGWLYVVLTHPLARILWALAPILVIASTRD